MKPIIRVYDKDLRFLGEVHDASSVIWTKRWSTYGDFEIHLDKPDPLFENGNYVMLNHDPYKCGVIEYDQDDGDGYQYNSTEDYVVKGYSLLFLLYHRITVPTSANDGYLVWNNKPAEDIMYELVDGQVIHPLDTKRVIPHFEAAANQHRGKKMTFRSRLKYLPDELYELSIESGLGVAVRFDPVGKRFIFEVLEGVDRRRTGLGTAINPDSYIFSRRNRKVKKHTYTHDTSSFKNMAYIGGQGDGDDRTIVTIYDDLSGLNRREAFIDARDIADENENESTNTALVDRGKTKLTTDFREVINYEYEAETEDYMVLWDLGDTCTYIDDKKQITLHQQVTEVQETHEDGQLKIDPTFGYTENSVSKSLASVTQATIVERTGISAKFTQLYADYAEIQTIVAGKADIKDLTAMNGKITNLEAGIVTITGNLNAAVADITTLKSNYVEVNKLVAEKASIESLNAVKAHIEDLEANIITVDQLNATNARVDILEAGNVTITGRLDAVEGHITDLTADNATINGKLTAAEANIGKLTADLVTTNALVAKKAAIEDLNVANAKIEKLEADIANVGDLSAITADIGKLKADVADIDTALIGKADIDLANIKNGCITTAMIGTGVIGTTQIADGSITDAKIVGLTANKITAGRLDAAQIEVVNLNAANITVGTINGVQIAPGAITGDKLAQQVNDQITGAANAAQQAQTTADGKNKIYYQNTQPGLTGNKKGDTWFDTANGYKAYIWDGTKWSASPFGSGALSDAVNSSITTAGSNASTALANAAAAKTAADQAAKDAKTAQSNANAAKTAADQAAKDLEAAEKNLAAVTGRVDATEEEIAAAQEAVTTAQNKANAAAQAAASAQSTADTAKQNAAAAQTKADSAYTLADQAKKAAATAQTSADGKNTVFYQTAQPPTTGRKTGDTWYNTAKDNAISKWDGSKWTEVTFGADAIADNIISAEKLTTVIKNQITTAGSNASTALTNAAAAKAAADQAKIDAQTAQASADTAQAAANQAAKDLAAAEKNLAAVTGRVDATEEEITAAQAAVTTAQNKANEAAQAAAAAQSTANTAKQNAATAQSKANSAYSLADQAKANAATAQSAANAAKDAATAADTLARAAQTSANSAQTTADGKNTVFYAAAAPTATGRKTNDIWFDTAHGNRMYYWNGSVWTLRPFGTNALANLSITNALIANAAINNAKIANLDAGKITTGIISADRIGTGTLTVGKLTEAALTEIQKPAVDAKAAADAAASAAATAQGTANTAKSTAETAKTNAATAQSAADAAKATLAAWCYNNNLTYIDGGDIYTGTVTAAKIAAGAITAEKLAAGAVTAAKIAAGTITGDKIAGKTISADKIVAGTITASSGIIANGAILSAMIGDAQIGTAKIANLAVTGAKIANATITNAQIADATIQSAKIAALDAGKITTGILAAARIAAGSITADKLASKSITVGQISDGMQSLMTAPLSMINGDLVYRDPTFKSGINEIYQYNNSSNGTVTVTRIAKPSDCPTKSEYCMQIKVTGSASPGSGGFVQPITSRANAIFIVKYLIKLPIGYSLAVSSNPMGSGYKDEWLTNTAGTGKWTEYVRKVTCGASGTFSSGGHIYVNGAIPTAAAPLVWYLGAIYLYDVTDSSYLDATMAAWCYNNNLTYINGGKIYTGTVTATQIAANAITAGKIAANAVTASTIVAGAVTLDKLAANSVNASKIVAGSITAAQLAAATITGDKIKAGAIAAGNLAANSVTSDKIVADAVTTAKIAAKAVTANEMAAGSITASNAALADACIITAKIADGAITNAKIANATIQSAKIAALDAAKITSGYIAAARIQAKSLTADKLNVSTLSAITANLGTVTAGVIKSANYAAGNAGMQLTLSNGTWDSPNFKIASDGKVDMSGNLTIKDSYSEIKFVNSSNKEFATLYASSSVSGSNISNSISFSIGSGILTLKSVSFNSGASYIPTINTYCDFHVQGEIYSGPSGSKSLLDRTYPVGSIYMSVNSTSPATLFGGTWVELQGRFLLGRSSSYANGSVGGAATVATSAAQMPIHKHGIHYGVNTNAPGNMVTIMSGNPEYVSSNPVDNNGGGSAHNNMPPYLAVYMWKRTA
ncbi:hypothetical protein [Eubacterium sp.]|uniref:Gp37-like protein n=1 Tax=Eubacterium sp. TaxID=142586 RepID=UPI0026DF38E6|nr:hypothetical protein [Eubacterium sp.]MDO5433372.1 hypothetical protein [Eubacterium sp.]